MMKNYIKKAPCFVLLLMLLAPAIALAQGIEIQAGGSIVNTGATTIEINNGGFINNGTYTKGGETFTMSGTTAAAISGTAVSDFNNLAIANTGGINIVNVAKVTASTNLTIGSGASLTLLSNAISTGSLIINGSLINSGTIYSECYIPGAAQTWHMLSGPMNGMAISGSDFEVVLGDQNDFYAWNEPSPGTWVNYKNTTVSPTFEEVNNGGDNFVSGKGYLIACNEIDPTKTFSGTPNYGAVSFNLKNSGLKSWTYVSGWNLIGNPYSSSIDWNLADRSQFQDNFAYIYNPNKSGGEGYDAIDGGSAGAYIAANQGFFVIAASSANNQNFTFTKAIQTHSNVKYLKSENNVEELTLRLSSESYYDETQIRIKEQSDFSRDRQDALKIFSFNNAIPQLYSQSADEVSLSVNSLPSINEELSINLGVLIPVNGAFILSLESVSEYLASDNVYLEDKLLGNWHQLTQSNYEFTAETGEINDRFVLHFGVVGIDENTNEFAENTHVWLNGGQLYVHSNNNIQLLEIFDLQGRKVLSKNIEGNNASIPLNFHAGMYLVRVQNSTTKIIVSSY